MKSKKIKNQSEFWKEQFLKVTRYWYNKDIPNMSYLEFINQTKRNVNVLELTESQLEKEYIDLCTKNWDEETKERYIDNVKEDFKEWHKGYKYALNI